MIFLPPEVQISILAFNIRNLLIIFTITITITITMVRMATEGMAILSESMEPGQGPELGHRLPQVDYLHDDNDDEYDYDDDKIMMYMMMTIIMMIIMIIMMMVPLPA